MVKSLPILTFETEKHKIYEKFAENRNKIDEFARKNNEFVEFRKGYLMNNERNNQEIIGLND